MKRALPVLLVLCLARAAAAQYDTGVISPFIEKPSSPTDYVFTNYAGGAAEGSYYYQFPTNITGYITSPRNYTGECIYSWPELTTLSPKEIAEDVIIYRGTNTAAAFDSGSAFTAMRTASPCFDGRFGEVSEATNHTWSYGGGEVDYVSSKSKYYILVNRVRGRIVSGSLQAGDWTAGDFNEVYIGAKDTLNGAATTPAGTSGHCRGEAVPTTDPDYCASFPFAWKVSPLVKLSTIGGVGYETLTPIVGAVNAATSSISVFNNLPSGAVLFGFMPFGLQSQGPNKAAAVAIVDTSSTIRPTAAVLYYRSGGVYVAATSGVMSQVPDDVSTTALSGLTSSLNDLEYDPNVSTWFAYGTHAVSTTAGCNDGTPGTGNEFVKKNLVTGANANFWASQNDLGRFTIDSHFVGNVEYISYSSTDKRCVDTPMAYQADSGMGLNQWRSMEIMVRKQSLGAPN